MKVFILLIILCSSAFASTWKNWQYVLQNPMIPHYIDSQNRKWSSNDSTIKVFRNSPFEVKRIKIFDNFIGPHGSSTITNYINDTLFVISVFDTPHVLITFNSQTEEFRYFPYPDTLPVLEKFGTRFGASPDGSFWIGASEQGMVHFDNGHWELYDSTNSTIRWGGDPHFSPDGSVWIPWGTTYGTQCGISIFDGKNWSHLDSSGFDIPISLNVSDIEFQKDGTVWLAVNTPFPRGNSNGGIIKYKNNAMNYYDPRKMWQDNYAGILQIDVDKDGTLWFDGRGFTKDLGLTWGDFMTDSLHIQNADELYGHFYLDTNTNSRWWETDQGPKYHWNNGSITKYDTIDFNKQMSNLTYCTSGPDSTIWFYYNWYMEPSVFEVLSLKNTIYTLYAPYMHNIANDTIHSLTVDNSNTKWISTNYGISRFNDSGWYAWGSTTLGMQNITSLFADSKGRIWGGCNTWRSGYGLLKYDNGLWSKDTTALPTIASRGKYDMFYTPAYRIFSCLK